MNDKSAIKKSEVLLLRAEQKFQALVETNVDFIWEMDAQGRYTYCSPQMEKLWGIKPEDMLGRTPFDLMPPGEKERALSTFLQYASSNNGVKEFGTTSFNGRGQLIFIETSAVPFVDDNGTLLGYRGTTRDITERKEIEERAHIEVRKARDQLELQVAERTKELHQERQRLLYVLETLPVGIFLLAPDYTMPFANRAFRERHGESNGRRCYEYIYGLDDPCESCQSLRPLQTGQPNHWLFTTPDGRIIDINDYPFTDADGTSLVLEMNMDITEQRKMEAELARLDRLNLIGEMAASIGHEIRNPMTAVRGFLQMLISKAEYADDQSYFDLMIEELDRANEIISEFLGMARNKMVDLQPRWLDSVVNALFAIIVSQANMREINVELDLQATPKVLIDENEIRQLILNMSRNAMEAMSFRGNMTIGTRQEGKEAILFIKDEGNGLCPEVIDKLGTPFLTTKENGTGLGLAVCYSIAARHKAKIDYETGQSGTTFYVRFPHFDQ